MLYDDVAVSAEIALSRADIVGHRRVAGATEFNGRWGLLEVAAA